VDLVSKMVSRGPYGGLTNKDDDQITTKANAYGWPYSLPWELVAVGDSQFYDRWYDHNHAYGLLKPYLKMIKPSKRTKQKKIAPSVAENPRVEPAKVTKLVTYADKVRELASQAPPVELKVVEQIKVKDVPPMCGTCNKHHFTGTCKFCGLRHCWFKDKCDKHPSKSGYNIPAFVNHVPQTRTQYSPLDSTIMASCMMLQGDPLSSGWKVKVSGLKGVRDGTYFHCCSHQVDSHLVVLHNNTSYTLSTEGVQFHPSNKDLIFIPWKFTNHSPDVRTVNLYVEQVNGRVDGELTFVGYDPGRRTMVSGGITNYTLADGRINYRLSTTNGSCGSGVFISTGGAVFLFGVHSGTFGPNNAYPNHAWVYNSPTYVLPQSN
jgi:hypothetical protein